MNYGYPQPIPPPRKKLKSLMEICTIRLLANVRSIDNVGEYPSFHLLRPVLRRMDASHLRRIEAQSPDLLDQTGPLWKTLIEKDFPKHTFLDDDESVGFSTVYLRLDQEQQQRRAAALHKLKTNQQQLQLARNQIVGLNEESSIRMVNLVVNRKRKKRFFGDDSEFKSAAMKKVKRDVNVRNNLFKMGPSPTTMLQRPTITCSGFNKSSRIKNSGLLEQIQTNSSSRSGIFTHRTNREVKSPTLRQPSTNTRNIGSFRSSPTAKQTTTLSKSLDRPASASQSVDRSTSSSQSLDRPVNVSLPPPSAPSKLEKQFSGRSKLSIFLPRSKTGSNVAKSKSPPVVTSSSSSSSSSSSRKKEIGEKKVGRTKSGLELFDPSITRSRSPGPKKSLMKKPGVVVIHRDNPKIFTSRLFLNSKKP